MEEEQEREVDHEVERERQVERPPRAKSMEHSVQGDVRNFIQTGIIRHNSKAFVPLFSPLGEIEPEIQSGWSLKLFSTKDFSVTIQTLSVLEGQNFLRPVNWIVSNARQELVVFSPFEVNALLPDIRRSHATHLHMYTPRTKESMRSFDDLRFRCIPPLPQPWSPPESLVLSQLNIWAGQLYLRDYGTFLELCRFLGIDTRTEKGDVVVQRDGFVLPSDRRAGSALQASCRFTISPVHFIGRVVGLRRKGISYLSSHVGKLVHGSPVREEDFADE